MGWRHKLLMLDPKSRQDIGNGKALEGPAELVR